MMSKVFTIFAMSAFVLASFAQASADEAVFDKCIASDRHDVCFAAMSTYEERMRHAGSHSEFCNLAIRYATLQGYDAALQQSTQEHKMAIDSIKMLIVKCDEPVKSLGRKLLQSFRDK